jgi:hypothetical protein
MEQVSLRELMNFQPKQTSALKALLDPKCKYLLYGGAMAGGKSYVLRWSAFYYSLWLSQKYGLKGIPVGLFSEDYPTLKDRQISKMAREFPSYLGDLKESKEEGFAFFIKDIYGGGRILLRNLDDPSKYMSSEFAGIFVEELTKNNEQTFQDLRIRLRFPGIDQVKFMGASNPGGVGHGWVRKYFVDKAAFDDPEKDRFSYVHATAYDNKYINQDYLRQLESLPLKKRKAFLEGNWDIFEGQVFVEWDREKHVIPPLVPKDAYAFVAGLDWGYSAPTVLLCGCLYPQDVDGKKFHRLIIYKEIDGMEITPENWAKKWKETITEFMRLKIYGDPAMFNKLQDSSFSIADQLRREGVYVHKSTNNRLNGITTIHNWLSQAPDGLPFMQITDNCRNLIRTLPEAMYDENVQEDTDRNWAEDHWYDSLRYLVSMLKWAPGQVGGVMRPNGQRVGIPKYQLMDKQGRLVSLDPSRFGEVQNKVGVYYPDSTNR